MLGLQEEGELLVLNEKDDTLDFRKWMLDMYVCDQVLKIL